MVLHEDLEAKSALVSFTPCGDDDIDPDNGDDSGSGSESAPEPSSKGGNSENGDKGVSKEPEVLEGEERKKLSGILSSVYHHIDQIE